MKVLLCHSRSWTPEKDHTKSGGNRETEKRFCAPPGSELPIRPPERDAAQKQNDRIG